MTTFLNTVAGQKTSSKSGRWIASVNPFTGKQWARVPQCDAQDVEDTMRAARAAYSVGAWPALTATARGKLLLKLAALIERDGERLAEVEVRDNGKLYTEVSAQVRYLPEWFRYFGGLTDKIEGSVLPIDKPGHFVYTRHEPLGVIVAITPWNSPLMLLGWKLASALAAGNTVVIKPSEFTSCSTLLLMDLIAEAEFPAGVVNTITGYGSEIGSALVEHPLTAKVAFTGGEHSGRLVYTGAARNLKPVTLELGGKSANIIFDDANLDDAVNGAIAGIFAASGQTCIAGSRLLVQRSIYEQVADRLVNIAGKVRLGDPMSPQTQVGPITTVPQRDKVLDYIAVGKAEGAQCLLGGKAPSDPLLQNGWFVEPTIFGAVSNKMRIAREEIFGPVLALIAFDDEDEAVEIANDSPYGLAAGVWTTDMRRCIGLAERLEAGTVWVNTYRAISFMAPFGGYKHSGIGRENGQRAIEEFQQTKSVWLSLTSGQGNPFVIR